MTKTILIAEPGKQELFIHRIFDAPPELVFKAYTDPTLIPQWWGPAIYKTTVDKMDPKSGGVWRFVQRDAEGREFAFHGVYHEIRQPERIVDTFEFEGMPGHVLLETATFERQGSQTGLTVQVVYQSVEDRDGMIASGMEQGMDEGMERLAELLTQSPGPRQPGIP